GGYIPQLVVGVWTDGKLFFVDSVKNGFVPTTRREVRDAIDPLRTPECPFDNLPEKKRPHAMDRGRRAKFDGSGQRCLVRWLLTSGHQTCIFGIQNSFGFEKHQTCVARDRSVQFQLAL